MFKNILGKKKLSSTESKEVVELREKISKMNITEMKSYINNRISDLKVSSQGLVEVLDRLTKEDEKTKKRYLKPDDDDMKKKKAFELVISIASNKQITLEVSDKIRVFIETYSEMVKEFDFKYKQIYASRLKKALDVSLLNISKMSTIKMTSDFLDS